jgi:hypothetical protein
MSSQGSKINIVNLPLATLHFFKKKNLWWPRSIEILVPDFGERIMILPLGVTIQPRTLDPEKLSILPIQELRIIIVYGYIFL